MVWPFAGAGISHVLQKISPGHSLANESCPLLALSTSIVTQESINKFHFAATKSRMFASIEWINAPF
jgi:hypothetical protein